MSWRIITDDWRLKLLAVGLAVLMLGAVAFSQNPPTTGSQTIQLGYVKVPANLILLNPPPSVTVTYTGTADEIQKAKNCSCFAATVDVSNARPGTNVQLDVAAKSSIADLNVQNPFPITVTIDSYVTGKDLPVQVSAHAAAGWSITKTAAACPNTPCVVHFSGPASWLKNMTATVAYPAAVNLSSIDSPNQLVQLTNTNGLVDLTTCRTDPCATLDTLNASIHIEAVPGSNSSTIVLLDSPPSHGPANGYRITAVTISPNTVTITGDPIVVGRIRAITLPAQDLTGKTSDASFPILIPYPDGVSGSVSTAMVKYSISPNPAVSPTPS